MVNQIASCKKCTLPKMFGNIHVNLAKFMLSQSSDGSYVLQLPYVVSCETREVAVHTFYNTFLL